MKTISIEELNEILENHRKWSHSDGGEQADLSYSDLRSSDLRSSDLRGSDLSYSDLRGSNLRGSDLSYSNLRSSDLSYSDLRSSNLRDMNGNSKEIKTIQTDLYIINYTKSIIQIGCENHSIDDWFTFNDDRIFEMDGKKALDWWKKWKPILQQIIVLEV